MKWPIQCTTVASSMFLASIVDAQSYDTFIAIGPISAVTVQYAIRLCNSVNI